MAQFDFWTAEKRTGRCFVRRTRQPLTTGDGRITRSCRRPWAADVLMALAAPQGHIIGGFGARLVGGWGARRARTIAQRAEHTPLEDFDF